ncbi:hypothetical protein P3T39_006285 [Kitasatospora sp. GP82]|nr:hypothetical protein [Kitasatospora sp. GP82]
MVAGSENAGSPRLQRPGIMLIASGRRPGPAPALASGREGGRFVSTTGPLDLTAG